MSDTEISNVIELVTQAVNGRGRGAIQQVFDFITNSTNLTEYQVQLFYNFFCVDFTGTVHRSFVAKESYMRTTGFTRQIQRNQTTSNYEFKIMIHDMCVMLQKVGIINVNTIMVTKLGEYTEATIIGDFHPEKRPVMTATEIFASIKEKWITFGKRR